MENGFPEVVYTELFQETQTCTVLISMSIQWIQVVCFVNFALIFTPNYLHLDLTSLQLSHATTHFTTTVLQEN